MLWIYISIKLIKQTNKQTTLKKEIKKKKEKSKQNTAFLKCFQAFGGNYSLSLQIVLVGPKPKLFQ